MSAENPSKLSPSNLDPTGLPPSARQEFRNPLPRMFNHASTVGHGVHKQYVAPPTKEDEAEHKPEAVDLSDEWSPTPSLKDQILMGQEYWKLDRVEVRLFDLSLPADVIAYNDLLTKTSLPDGNVILVQNDRQWYAQTGTWRACVELQHVLYRRVIKKKDDHEKASSN